MAQRVVNSKRKITLRHAAIRLVLIAVGAALALALAEILMIAADIAPIPSSGRTWEVPNALYGWSYLPGATFKYDGRYERFRAPSKINSKGLREREYTYEKKNGIFRVLILGDSFTASLEVPLKRTWHEILEAELNKGKLAPAGVEIIAAGIQGWSTDQEYLYYLHEGYKYHPDLVLLQFYANDIYGDGVEVQRLTRRSRAPKKPFFVVRDRQLVRIDPLPVEPMRHAAAQTNTEQAGRGAAQDSNVLRQAKDFLRAHLRTYRVAAQVKQARAGGNRPRSLFCYPYDGVPPELFVWAPKFPREYAAAWDVTARVIGALKGETAKRGQRLAVLYIPTRGQVLPGEWQRTLECWPAAARLPWDRGKPNHLLDDLLIRLNTPYLDLTEPFQRTAAAGQSPYLETDWHLNLEGHRRVAAILVEWLARASLIPH